MPARRPPSLPTTSVFVVLGCGALAVMGIALLGLVQFYRVPGAEPAPGSAITQNAAFAFLFSLGLISVFFLIVAAVAAWISGRAVSGDVEFVTRRVRAIADRGDLGEPVAIRTLDEVGALTRSYETLRSGYLKQLARDRVARRKAQDADLMKTEFLTTVSHELRTPLNSILGFTQVLLSEIDGPLSHGQAEDLQMIETSGEHLLSLFNNVLDLSALVSGRIELKLSDVALEEVLEEAVEVLDAQRQGRPIALLLDVHGPLPMVSADRPRILQVVMNLAGNALKFTDSGEVRLTAERVGKEVIVRVRDTGVGIDPRDLQTIFEEYRQVGPAGARQQQGSGLGLSICHQVVTLHRGRLWADSRPGWGSTFCFALPISVDTLSSDRQSDEGLLSGEPSEPPGAAP